MGRSLRSPLGGVLTLGFLSVGCVGDAPADPRPSVTVVDGVEIAVLPPVPDPLDRSFAGEFRVVREIPTETGQGTAQPIIFNPRRVLPLRNGTLLVHDPQADEPLVILDVEDRSVSLRFGRNGRGPGELSIALDFTEAPDGSIHVIDRGNRQVHEFASSGEHLVSERLELNEFSSKSFPSPERSSHFAEVTAAASGGRMRRLARLGSDPPEVHPVLELPALAPGVRGGDIQQGRVLWTVVGDNLVVMRSDVPVVMIHDLEGDLVREIRLPFARRTMTEADIREQVGFHGDLARFLKVGPAALTNELYAVNDTVFGMFLDALWRPAEDPTLPVGAIWWRMFSVRGTYIGVVRVPEDVTWLWQGGDHFWATVLSKEGVPVLQELTIDRLR